MVVQMIRDFQPLWGAGVAPTSAGITPTSAGMHKLKLVLRAVQERCTCYCKVLVNRKFLWYNRAMLQRIFALVFIFICTAVAWFVLGATIMHRTQSSGAGLKGRVASTWGGPHEQRPPEATWQEERTVEDESVENGKKVVHKRTETITHTMPLERSRATADLTLDYRQKGLMWYSTYSVSFAAAYTFRNTSNREQMAHFALKYPAAQAVYDGLEMAVDGKPLTVRTGDGDARAEAPVAAGAVVEFRAAYRSKGLDRWSYAFGEKVAEANDFGLVMRTNFRDIDFPDNTLSPTVKRERPGGWELEWNYKRLLSGFPIAMAMPEKLQPGPLAGEISFFAPVSLFFFFFILWLITTLRGINLHPMNYFFLACAFFAFHLLLAYLADHISIHAAFALSALVSLALVISYLRLVVGIRFAAREAALAQSVYLVLFSYAFFFKGYTGLAVTIGAILTLFVTMQATGRVRWESVARPPETK